MNIKKGDTVQIMAGKDRGKRGRILSAFPQSGRVLVEGLNLFKKHVRPRTQGAKGEIVSIAKPLPIANVRLICGSCKRPVRVGYRMQGEKRERYCKKCNNVV